jgi:hypothetical protein
LLKKKRGSSIFRAPTAAKGLDVMKKFARITRNLFLLTSMSVTPAFGQALDLSQYDTLAGPNGIPPAFTSDTPEADGRPGQYYFNVGALAFTHHDYAFAVQMYQVAASWAYKPAEYNLAIMYALGQGTAVDLPRAMAWMTLAAERKNPKYLQDQALVAKNLKPGDSSKADDILKELEPRYGDKHALHRAKNRWAQVQSNATGSLTGHPIGPLQVSNAGRTSTDGSLAYQRLMASDDPYNIGTVTVGALAPVKPVDESSDDQRTSKKPDVGAPPKADHPLP